MNISVSTQFPHFIRAKKQWAGVGDGLVPTTNLQGQ